MVKNLKVKLKIGVNLSWYSTLDLRVEYEDEAGFHDIPYKDFINIPFENNLELEKYWNNNMKKSINLLPEMNRILSGLDAYINPNRLITFLEEFEKYNTCEDIEIIIPKEYQLNKKKTLRLLIEPKLIENSNLVSYLKLNTILDWNWKIAIDDEIIDINEFYELLEKKEEVVKFRDKYIRIDKNELLKIFNNINNKDKPDNFEILKRHFSDSIIHNEETKQIFKKMFIECNYSVPASLKATLRPYQINGYNWICSNLISGFGCILADDMGLGKTIQAITVILCLKEKGFINKKCLVVVPAALLENWASEFNKFAPVISVSKYYGKNRIIEENYDVLLTTYQTIVRDKEKFKDNHISLLIIDEAHLLKNSSTQISKAIKGLKSQYKLALSGTPVENRLEDLRSLFDFIFPGYLGTATEFKNTFRIPIEVKKDVEIADYLRKITNPFLLRRLKTDKSIITDLPDKIVTNEYSLLEKDQLALYQSVINNILEKTMKVQDPSKRTSFILNLLTSLKQICNHPRIFDKTTPAKSEYSGKTKLLLVLLEEILCNNEKVIIFSQYVETLNCLETIIKNELNESILIYHGTMSQNERNKIISLFQEDINKRILLISLKAGGLGLNLTSASRVIHYDLWYNPAIENQATDRAFRIGQKRNVFVHRFISKNTFEEKIDQMLQNKTELINMTVSTGESWISRMSDKELKDLFNYEIK